MKPVADFVLIITMAQLPKVPKESGKKEEINPYAKQKTGVVKPRNIIADAKQELSQSEKRVSGSVKANMSPGKLQTLSNAKLPPSLVPTSNLGDSTSPKREGFTPPKHPETPATVCSKKELTTDEAATKIQVSTHSFLEIFLEILDFAD